MTRQQWIVVIALILLILIAIGVGILIWSRKKPAYLIETVPGTSAAAVVTPVAVGKSRTPQTRKAQGVPTTYREILGKRQ